MATDDTIATAVEAGRVVDSAGGNPARRNRPVAPMHEDAADSSCPSCGAATSSPSYVYALGQVEPRFPSLAVEKEMAQVTGRADTAGLTDRQALHTVLSERRNRYLVRHLCWVFTIEALDTYILRPRDPADWDLLVDAIRPRPKPGDIDTVIGIRGPIAPPDVCNGLSVPIVSFTQLYSYDEESLIRSIPKPRELSKEQFIPAAERLFREIMQVADNAGATDEHRALNYVATRYPAIYATATEAHARNAGLAGIEVRPSRLSGVRTIVDIIFSFNHRQTDVVEKHFTRVDVTEEFPFLVTKLSPYYDR
jgi:cyclic patellamide precursor peptide PatG